MTVEEFAASDGSELSAALLALWWDARGDWEKAHEVAQDVAGPDGSWVHAYLHRKEGDLANASYWYRRAGRPVGAGDSRSEWEGIVREMLGGRTNAVHLMKPRVWHQLHLLEFERQNAGFLHCAAHDETVSSFGRNDDLFFSVKKSIAENETLGREKKLEINEAWASTASGFA
jgi:hypothetical protein